MDPNGPDIQETIVKRRKVTLKVMMPPWLLDLYIQIYFLSTLVNKTFYSELIGFTAGLM